MVRPSDWWVLDLEGDPTPGSPAAVRRMARTWATVAQDAAWAERRVRQLMGDEALGKWIGEAGEAFRAKTGDLPGQLGKCADSYGQASDALSWWAGRLETHQADADAALVRGRAAHADLEEAKRRAADAAASVSHASGVPVLTDHSLAPTPEQVRDAQARLHAAQAARSSADSAVSAAQSRLDAARKLALDAKHLRESDGRTTADRIHEAADAGIPERSRWEKFKDWAGEAWDVIVQIAKVVVAVLGVVALIIGGPLAWVVFAAALILLADSIMRYMRGECALWEVALAALGCIPGTKGLTTLAELRLAAEAGGLVGAGVHVLASGKAALVEMARGVRALAGLRGIGSWTGEGLSLGGRDLALVNDFAADAIRFEPGISRSLRGIVADLPTSELGGFEARLKSFDSLARKTATAMDVRGATAAEALGGVKDSIRYTVLTPGEDFAAASAQVTERLSAQGFENISFKNTFGGPDYQGINTTWHDPRTGHAFEVQFHTPESFEAKTLTHEMYEEIRLPSTSPERAAELSVQQQAIFDSVPRPPGAHDVGLPPGAAQAPGGGTYAPDPGVGDYWRKPVQLIGFESTAALTPEPAR